MAGGELEVPQPQQPPVLKKTGAVARPVAPQSQATLPLASIVYGMATSILVVVALYFMMTGRWFTGGLVLLPAICFLGFSLQYLKTR